MSEIQPPSTRNPVILIGAGILCLLGGLLMLAERAGFASFFLGGNFPFGIPLTESDAFKMLFIEGVSFVTIGMGLILLVVGLILNGKIQKGSAQGSPSVPLNR